MASYLPRSACAAPAQFSLPRDRAAKQALKRVIVSAVFGALVLAAGCGDGGGADPNAAGPKADGSGQPHVLGGTITGLTSSGLRLASGDDSVTVPAGASSFEFAKTYGDGASYSVTIASQPGGFNRCALSEASGVFLTSDIRTIALNCQQADAAVSTLAGDGLPGASDGTGTAATFKFPYAVVSDSLGNIYVADAFNHMIRRIAPDGSVSSFAGNGSEGAADGTASSASFSYPFGLAIDSAGALYVADWGNHSVRKIATDGTVSTLAGSGASGASDGAGASASFNRPFGVATDSGGNVYVADTNNNSIRRITAAGVVSTLAGGGAQGAGDGTGAAARFNSPQHLSIDAAGNLLVADTGNHLIRHITSTGVVSTLAGSGQPGAVNGPANAASFREPSGIAVDTDGTVYVADSGNNLIRRISPNGVVSNLAGSAIASFADGSNAAAGFSLPFGVAITTSGQLLVADARNHSVRRIVAQ